MGPTTAAPSTTLVPTGIPTSVAPSTNIPSTLAPSTAVPSTGTPTTAVPSTAQPPAPPATATRERTASISIRVAITATHTIGRTRTRTFSRTIRQAKLSVIGNASFPVGRVSRESVEVRLLVLGTTLVSPTGGTILTECLLIGGAANGTDMSALLRNATLRKVASSPSEAVLTLPVMLVTLSADLLVNVTLRSACLDNHLECWATILILAPPAPPPSLVTSAFESGQVVAAVGAVINPNVAAIAQVNRISLSSVLVACDYNNGPLGFYNSPLNLNIGSSHVSYSLGAVVGNMLILGTMLAAQAAVIAIFLRVRQPATFADAASAARFPSAAVFPLLFVQQPTMTAATSILLWGSTGGEYFVALIGLAVCISSLAVTYWCISQANFGAEYIPEAFKKARNPLSRILYGTGRWADTDPASNYKQRHQFMFSDYTSRCHYFMLVEMSMNVVCGTIQGMVSPTYCYTMLGMASIGFFVFTTAAVLLRPYNSPWRAFVSVGMCVIQLVGATSTVVGVYYNYPAALDASSSLSVLCFYFLFLQAVVELWPRLKTLRRLWNNAQALLGRGVKSDPSIAVVLPGDDMGRGDGDFQELAVIDTNSTAEPATVAHDDDHMRDDDMSGGDDLLASLLAADAAPSQPFAAQDDASGPVLTLLPTFVDHESILMNFELNDRNVAGDYLRSDAAPSGKDPTWHKTAPGAPSETLHEAGSDDEVLEL